MFLPPSPRPRPLPPAAASAPLRSQAKHAREEKQNAPALKDESRAATAPAVGGSAHLERDFAKTPAAPTKPDEPLAQARKKEAAPFPAAPVTAAPSAQNAPPPPEAPSETTAVRGLRAQPEQESTCSTKHGSARQTRPCLGAAGRRSPSIVAEPHLKRKATCERTTRSHVQSVPRSPPNRRQRPRRPPLPSDHGLPPRMR